MPLTFRFWGHKTPTQIVENTLGPREREVMALVWAEGEISARGACAKLDPPVAYTTAMTTLDRLFKKGLLARRKVGQAFLYTAAVSRGELERAVARGLVQGLLQRGGGEPLPILSSLVDTVGDQDRTLLDDLERLIREKRLVLEREGEP